MPATLKVKAQGVWESGGGEFSIRIELEATVLALKTHVAARLGTTADGIRLVCAGKLLSSDGATLASQGVNEAASVICIKREAEKAQPEPSQALGNGMVVRIVGLPRSDLNGRVGTCQWDAQRCRWVVRRGTEIFVVPHQRHLEPQGPRLQAGMLVRIAGMVKRADMNGQVGTCETWDSGSGLWHVRLNGLPTQTGVGTRTAMAKVRPQNLQPSGALPGGLRFGDGVYFTGASEDRGAFKVRRGLAGLVTGPSAAAPDVNAVDVLFDGNPEPVGVLCQSLARTPVGTLPGGFGVGDAVYFVGADEAKGTFRVQYGMSGIVTGLAKEDPGNALEVLFECNPGPIGVLLTSISCEQPAARSSSHFSVGSRVFYKGAADRCLRVVYGMRGHVVGVNSQGSVRVNFGGGPNDVDSADLSLEPLSDLHGLYFGQRVFYSGTNHTFKDGSRLHSGWEGRVIGRAATPRSVHVKFLENKVSVDVPVASVVHERPVGQAPLVQPREKPARSRSPRGRAQASGGGSSGGAARPRKALVIGNNYPGEKGKLQGCENDANAMQWVLQAPRTDFRVNLATNMNYTVMQKRITEFGSSLRDGDCALFYFSGHGMMFDGVLFLVPTEMPELTKESDIKRFAVSLHDVMEAMFAAGEKGVKIVIIDACRSRVFERVATKSMSFMSKSSHFSEMQKMPKSANTIAIYAAAEATEAFDGTLGGFTKELVNLIPRPGLEINGLTREIRKRLHRSGAIPHDDNAMLEEFFFTL